MKSILTIALALALTCTSSTAKTLQFPNKGAAMFSITIPDDWEPEKDEDEVIEALSPDEKVYLSIWELESKEDAKNLGKDILDLLKDHAKKIKLEGEPQEAHPGGMDGLLFKGHALDKDDDHAIEFFALLVNTKAKAAVIFIEADADTSEAESAKLQKILQSITPPAGKRLLHAAIAVDKETKPATSFSSDVPQLHAFYVGDALKAGDVLSGVWIAEDVGDAAPKNTTIDEAASIKIKDPAEPGAFSLSKPTKGWPVGSYRVEISVNGKLAETVKFKIVK